MGKGTESGSLGVFSANRKSELKTSVRPTTDFKWTQTKEPHAERRTKILKAHPEIQKLFGHEWRTKYIVAVLVAIQLGLAVYFRDKSNTWQFYVTAYLIGGTVNHALFLAIHEISHNLAFKNFAMNRYFSIFANLPIGLPYAIAFKGYHQDHHKYQGFDGIDTDIPTRSEALLLQNVLTKVLFCIFQILFYALRPTLAYAPQINRYFVVNWIVQLSFSALLVYQFGMGALGYLLVSDFFAGSLHPCAGHFIAEHFVFIEGYETYSYYGILNALSFNVGYHNEHHDFPNIAWSKLPEVKRLAPEFYDNLPYHDSWVGVLYHFILDPNITGFSRVKRRGKLDNSNKNE